MHPDTTIAGIDLGGSYVRVTLMTAAGKMLARGQSSLVPQEGAEKGIALIQRLIEQALEETGKPRLVGIGIGASGPVDPLRGLIQNPYTLPTWDNVPITAELEQRFQIPVVLENDADAAALGEYWQGAGQNIARLYAVTVGTGIGTAFLQCGEVYRGKDGLHPEGGHHQVDPHGPACYCGLNGCWESLASGTAIAAYARQHVTEGSRLLSLASGNRDAITAAHVAQAAREGDAPAQRVMERAAGYFALGLMNVIAFFTPDLIVLSGGVMRSLDLFLPAIQAAVTRYNVMLPAETVRIVPARLAYDAGMIGAAYACLRKLDIS